jgi:PAS domain S-box-containing protein
MAPSDAVRTAGQVGSLHVHVYDEREFAATVVELSQVLTSVFDREGRVVAFNRACEEATGYRASEVVGRLGRETIIPPEDVQVFDRILERAFESGASSPVRGSWLTKDGGRRTIEFSNRPLRDAEGAVTYFVATGLDVTERERATAEITRLASEQGALRRVATSVARAAKPEQIFEAVAEEAGRLLGADQAATIRFDGDVAVTVGRWWQGAVRGFEVGATVPLTNSDALTARIARTGRPARIDDYSRVGGEVAEQMVRLGYRSGIAAPIVVDGHTWGTLMVASAAAEPFSRDAEQRLCEFTELVALALESAQAHADLTASRARIVSAGDAARQRLERNLHDGAQQRLVALSLQIRLAQSRLHDDPDEAERLLAAVMDELQLALEELRELARGLHPAVLSERGLGPALEALVARAPFPVEITGNFGERLPGPVEAALYYVASESLANAAKHASPSVAVVRHGVDADSAWVEVEDDGGGGAHLDGGSGLQGLADRIAALGGRFALASPTGAGTLVRAELPLQQRGVSRIADPQEAVRR